MSEREFSFEYVAIPDPDDRERMTYWRVSGAALVSWPPHARYGPVLLRSDIPKGVRGNERAEWIHAWFAEHRNRWLALVRRAVDSDRAGASTRFAAFTCRCCSCGRALTDAASKTYGVGPECRRYLSADYLAVLSEWVGRAHAEAIALGIEVPA